MPVHDWTVTYPEIYDDFCHSWTYEIYRALNGGLLPPENYALIEAELGFQALDARNQNSVVVRHVDGDRIIAVIELVSYRNKSSQSALRSFVEKAVEFLSRNIHLVVVDLFPPGPRDPDGIHAAIWKSFTGHLYELPDSNPLTLAAYEAAGSVRAFVEHPSVGEPLQSMPLYLRPRAHIPLPLEDTYNSAFSVMARRWRDVLMKVE